MYYTKPNFYNPDICRYLSEDYPDPDIENLSAKKKKAEIQSLCPTNIKTVKLLNLNLHQR